MSSELSASTLPPAGWYPDPENPGNDRWWDGSAWSDYRRPDGAVPLGAAPAGAARGGIGGNTPALVGFILAASSVLFPFVLNSFAGGIVSAVGLGRARRLAAGQALATGRGFALAGVLIGFIWGAICLIGVILAIVFWVWIVTVTHNVHNSYGPVI
jgi:hypothetical protein